MKSVIPNYKKWCNLYCDEDQIVLFGYYLSWFSETINLYKFKVEIPTRA